MQPSQNRERTTSSQKKPANHTDEPNSSRSDETRPEEIPAPKSYWQVYVATLLAIVLFGCYAQYLNFRLYQTDAPFYDSISYYDRVHKVMSLRQTEGLMAAVQDACLEKSTLCLPYLLSIPFSYFVEPCRAVGVWIEIIYFATFLLSLVYFLQRVFQPSRLAILMAVAPFFLLSALYRERAGISDLRVDLPMAFLYGAATCWLFLACRLGRWRDFVIAGGLLTAACLSRAIAPVYLIGGLGPILVWEFWRSRNRFRLSMQTLTVVAIVGVGAGWFYIQNFEYLYYYYFVWNTDANANVSMLRACKHFLTAAKSIGPFIPIYLVMIYFISKAYTASERNESNSESLPQQKESEPTSFAFRDSLIWFGWAGLAPIAILIAKRADLNPVVSLPGAIGFVVFWMITQWARISHCAKLKSPRVAISFATCLLLAMTLGYFKHVRSKFPDSAKGQRQLLQSMIDDAESSGREKVTYSVAIMTLTHNGGIKSSLQYEYGAKYVSGLTLEHDQVRFESKDLFFLPAQANWDRIPGETIDEKIALLVEQAVQETDYLIVPTRESFATIEQRYSHSQTSKYVRKVIDEIDHSNVWQPVSGVIRLEPSIDMMVLKNVGAPRTTFRQTQGTDVSKIR